MRLLFVLIIVALSAGCSSEGIPPVDSKNDINYGIQVKDVNNCQYVIVKTYEAVAMVHAGNCNNPTHTPFKIN